MEENSVINLIAMETAEPKHKLNRSAGAIYVALIALIIGAISLANLLDEHWQISRLIVQPALYAAIAICSWIVYRRHYISYRYTLTDRMFAIDRISGNRERTILAVPLTEINWISVFKRGAMNQKHIHNASILPRQKSIYIEYRENEAETIYRISPSDEFFEKLTAYWRTAGTQKE